MPETTVSKTEFSEESVDETLARYRAEEKYGTTATIHNIYLIPLIELERHPSRIQPKYNLKYLPDAIKHSDKNTFKSQSHYVYVAKLSISSRDGTYYTLADSAHTLRKLIGPYLEKQHLLDSGVPVSIPDTIELGSVQDHKFTVNGVNFKYKPDIDDLVKRYFLHKFTPDSNQFVEVHNNRKDIRYRARISRQPELLELTTFLDSGIDISGRSDLKRDLRSIQQEVASQLFLYGLPALPQQINGTIENYTTSTNPNHIILHLSTEYDTELTTIRFKEPDGWKESNPLIQLLESYDAHSVDELMGEPITFHQETGNKATPKKFFNNTYYIADPQPNGVLSWVSGLVK